MLLGGVIKSIVLAVIILSPLLSAQAGWDVAQSWNREIRIFVDADYTVTRIENDDHRPLGMSPNEERAREGFYRAAALVAKLTGDIKALHAKFPFSNEFEGAAAMREMARQLAALLKVEPFLVARDHALVFVDSEPYVLGDLFMATLVEAYEMIREPKLPKTVPGLGVPIEGYSAHRRIEEAFWAEFEKEHHGLRGTLQNKRDALAQELHAFDKTITRLRCEMKLLPLADGA